MNERPLVSVWMIAYNHGKFVSEAIESVLMQKTSFPFELVIGEDFSSDNTRIICEEFAVKNPDIINLLSSEKNLGLMPNFIRTLNGCKGKYIALCEGDDYWTDPYKLQKQVDFLEENPEYSLCFHNAEYKFENTGKPNKLFNTGEIKRIYDIKDTIECTTWYVPTPSIVFRREMLDLPSWLQYVQQGDKALQLILATKGNFYYLDEVMCVYRKHATSLGAITEESKTKIRQIQMYSYFNAYTYFLYNESVERKIQHFKSKYEETIMIEKKIGIKTVLFSIYFHYFRKYFKIDIR